MQPITEILRDIPFAVWLCLGSSFALLAAGTVVSMSGDTSGPKTLLAAMPIKGLVVLLFSMGLIFYSANDSIGKRKKHEQEMAKWKKELAVMKASWNKEKEESAPNLDLPESNLTESGTATEQPTAIQIFQQLAIKLAELLSDVKVIKGIVADLVHAQSYETQFETATYRKLEALQLLKNNLSGDLCMIPMFRCQWDDTFNQALDEKDDIIALIRVKRTVVNRAQGLFGKLKGTVFSQHAANVETSVGVSEQFESLVRSMYERLMSRSFVRDLTASVVATHVPSSSEEAQRLYEDVLDRLKWLTSDLDLYRFGSIEKLSYDLLKRQTPKFDRCLGPPTKYVTMDLPLQEQELRPKKNPPVSPFASKISLEEHFKSRYIAGIPDGLNDVVLPVAAAHDPRYSPLIKELGVVPERGMILYGPPGTGKTVMAQAIAGYLGCPDKRVTITSGSNLLDKWVGSTEASIRGLFKPARADEDHLYVIIIDEIDAILSTRQHAKNSWERTQVTQFLTELDGIRSPKNVFVIGITNFIDHLDPAAIRPGRLGSLIGVPLPDLSQRIRIFELHLSFISQCQLAEPYECMAQALSELTNGFSGADIRAVVQRTANMAFMETIRAGHFNDSGETAEFDRPMTMDNFLPVIEFIYKQKSATGLAIHT